MLRKIMALAFLAATASATTFLACSSSSAPGGCSESGGFEGCPAATSTPAYTSCLTDLTTPTVSFARDIQPLFNRSCGITGSTCHGSPATNPKTTGLVFLGLPDGGTDSGEVLTGIVGQPSPEDPRMDIIKAGDPAHSYLMHKLDGDSVLFASDCNGAHNPNPAFVNCGCQMPYNSGNLDADAGRDNIRRWIAQGAKNN